jgi:hypothetical protein
MSNSVLNNNELSNLRALLPYGSIALIAKNAGVSREAVKEILKGKWYNDKVLVEALKIAEQAKQNKLRMADKIKAVIA